jgi:hypothetical protein
MTAGSKNGWHDALDALAVGGGLFPVGLPGSSPMLLTVQITEASEPVFTSQFFCNACHQLLVTSTWLQQFPPLRKD